MKKRNHIKLQVQALIAIELGTALLFTACSYPSQELVPSIQIDGFSTVYPITQKAVAKFKASHDKPVEITVDISGTGGGFRKFCQGHLTTLLKQSWVRRIRAELTTLLVRMITLPFKELLKIPMRWVILDSLTMKLIPIS